MVVFFGARPLLPRGLAAAGELSLLFLLTLSKPLFARVLSGLGLFNNALVGRETLTIWVGASGENWAPP